MTEMTLTANSSQAAHTQGNLLGTFLKEFIFLQRGRAGKIGVFGLGMCKFHGKPCFREFYFLSLAIFFLQVKHPCFSGLVRQMLHS